MSKSKCRLFSRAFKQEVIERLEAGESASVLARKVSVDRPLLSRWRDAFRHGGEAALRSGPGRPAGAEAVAMSGKGAPSAAVNDLASAQRKIAELERQIGQQPVGLDFFKQALRRIEASRRPNDGRGVTASSRASKRLSVGDSVYLDGPGIVRMPGVGWPPDTRRGSAGRLAMGL